MQCALLLCAAFSLNVRRTIIILTSQNSLKAIDESCSLRGLGCCPYLNMSDLITLMKSFAVSLSLSISLAGEMKLSRVKGCQKGTANSAEDHGKRSQCDALAGRMGP